MKKVLVLGHFWPFHRGGSKRMLGLAKYLPEYDWEPIILTGVLQGKPDRDYRCIETPSANRIASLKKMLGFNPKKGVQEQIGIPTVVRERHDSITTRFLKTIEAVVTYPDVEIGWKPHALKEAHKLFSTEKVDGIISVWPIVTHLIAKELKDTYRVPWIADFPDMWTYTYAYRYGRVRRFMDKRLELQTLRRADELVTSSWPQSRVLERLHKRELVHTIKIGFDPECENVPPAPLVGKFAITYTGVLYGKERNPTKFLAALAELINEEKIDPAQTEVRFYGDRDGSVDVEIERLRLASVVKQYGVVSWEECLARQRETQLLLHLNWEDPNEKGAYSGKISEYLAARRPIISVGGFGGDVIEELFNETKIGSYCPRVQDIKMSLLRYYDEYKRSGSLAFTGDENEISKNSYRRMAEEFATLMNSVNRK